MEDLLKDIELPPNAPQFGELAPPKPAETKRPIQTKFERPQEKTDSNFPFADSITISTIRR